MNLAKTACFGLLIALAANATAQVNDAGVTPPPSRTPIFNQPQAVNGSGSFDGSETTMSPRFFRSGTPADACAEFSSGAFQYQAIPIRSDAGGSITASFDPGTCGTNVFVTFHTGTFNPASICQGYVWSFGSSQLFNETFAVPANTDMVMVVSGVANAPGVVCGPYTYSLTGANPQGGGLPPPLPRPAIVPSLGAGGLTLLALVLTALGMGALMRRK